jgi:hypothetical protein
MGQPPRRNPITIQQLPRLVTRGSLIAAPLTHLTSALAAASLATGAAAEVASITRHPDRYYAYTLLQLIGTRFSSRSCSSSTADAAAVRRCRRSSEPV